MPKIQPKPDRVACFDSLPDHALTDRKTLSVLTSLSDSSIYRAITAGRLAKPISIGPNSVRWRVADVRAFLKGGVS
jgi:predicted DNA-binding transcriptional regulator AlpA